MCELVLSIDWKTHKVEIKKQAQIQHNPNWNSDGTLNEVTGAVHAFNKVAKDHHLKKGLIMTIADGVDINLVNNTFGWQTAQPRKRASGLSEGYSDRNPDLKELNIQFIIDENL